MTSSRAYNEKRDFRRLNLDDCPVHYSLTAGGSEGVGVVKNLSATGLLMVVPEALPVGAGVAVKIRPERALVSPYEAEGEIVRAEPAADGYAVAIRIANGDQA